MDNDQNKTEQASPSLLGVRGVINIFTPMLDEWRAGRPVVKLCYGLTNEHMKALDELDAITKYGRP